MHLIVRYYIRTSILFLFAGVLLGFYFLLDNFWLGSGYPSIWVTAHVHVILIGFVMMMIFGVAQWMFPRPAKEDVHYSPDRAAFIYYLLTISTGVRFILELCSRWLAGAMIDYGITICAALQILAFVFFFYNMWTRIRPLGSQIREQAGERF